MAWQIAGFCGLVAGFASGVATNLIMLSIVAEAWEIVAVRLARPVRMKLDDEDDE